METVIILLIIVLIILYNSSVNSNRQAMEKLQSRLDQLMRETTSLRDEVKGLSAPKAESASPLAKGPVKTQPKTLPPPPQPMRSVAQPPVSPQPRNPERPYKEVPSPKYEPMRILDEDTWWQKWLRNNPDLEKFIGENLVNKIGIGILVLGIAFFVKYAIDQNWINQVGRVCIGLFCGMLLMGLAHYLRKNYRSFSSVLAGGGIAVFYFTIAFAFHQYHLLSQTATFLVMVVITGYAIALSILYNRIELAVIAAVGGFLTPFLVSTSEGNYVVLFTYLVILNSGLMALAFFKRWPLLNVLALIFTELIYGGWLVKSWWEGTRNISYPVALAFATAFYLLFLSMNTVYQVKHRLHFKSFDYTLLLLLNGSYFAAGIYLLQHVNNGQFNGLFTASIGFINFWLARYFFRHRQSYNTELYVFIGLTLTFLSLTIPIQLQGHAITLFWSVETVLLLWLYLRSRIHLFYYASLLVTVLTIGSLLIDWEAATRETSSLVLIYTNLQGLITNIVAAVAFTVYALLLAKGQDTLPSPMKKKTLLQVYGLAAFCLAYLTAIYGVNLIFRSSENYNVPNVYHRLITETSIAAVIAWLYHHKIARYQRLVVGAVLIYMLYHLCSFAQITSLRNGVLEGRYAVGHWAMHWVSVAAAVFLFVTVIQSLRGANFEKTSIVRFSWVGSILLLIFSSQEMAHLFVVAVQKAGTIDYLEDQYLKTVLTIVWGLCSFMLMLLGMRHKNKTLRIISLSVFCLALLKLFFFDLANISEGGKIIAFILLGVLLLTISFMYQRLKKMIIEDESR